MHSEYDVESGPAEMKTMPGLVFLVEIMERMLLINMMVVTVCSRFTWIYIVHSLDLKHLFMATDKVR